MKIKQEKQLTLPQLIEWAYCEGSDVIDEKFESESMTVIFNEIGAPHIKSKFHFLQVDELFTVEVEEVVDEDTVFEILLEIRKSKAIYTYAFESINKINKMVGSSSKEFHAYIDGEFKCVWRDGKLVE